MAAKMLLQQLTNFLDGVVPESLSGAGSSFLAGFSLCIALSVFYFYAFAPSPAAAPGGSSTASRVAVIASIGTCVPERTGDSDFFLRVCSAIGYDAKLMAVAEKISRTGGITTRHVTHDAPAETFASSLDVGRARAELWELHAPKMAVAAARQALEQWPHGSAADVTHVVVHSCTGFAAPGLDFALITELGLPSSTRKLGVNFMGCFGFFTATYVAKQIVEADTTGKAVVLVACAEVCSSHVTSRPIPELLVGNTLFADGGACAVITHAGFRSAVRGSARDARAMGPRPDGVAIDPKTNTPAFRISGACDDAGAGAGGAGPAENEWAIGAMSSEIIADSAGAMTWRQSADRLRYDMYLDRSIPTSLAKALGSGAIGLLRRAGIFNPWKRTAWAVHPGGKAILTGFSTALAALGIPARGIECSAAVLNSYGNMSSPTIAYVLQRVLSGAPARDADQVFIAGFGPGLTIEFGRLYKVRRGGVGGAGGGAGVAVMQVEEAPSAEVLAAAEAAAAALDAEADAAEAAAAAASAARTAARATSSSSSSSSSVAAAAPAPRVSSGSGSSAAAAGEDPASATASPSRHSSSSSSSSARGHAFSSLSASASSAASAASDTGSDPATPPSRLSPVSEDGGAPGPVAIAPAAAAAAAAAPAPAVVQAALSPPASSSSSSSSSSLAAGSARRRKQA